eukprot:8360650-Pyramimonas_sp.AAC.1
MRPHICLYEAIHALNTHAHKEHERTYDSRRLPTSPLSNPSHQVVTRTAAMQARTAAKPALPSPALEVPSGQGGAAEVKEEGMEGEGE